MYADGVRAALAAFERLRARDGYPEGNLQDCVNVVSQLLRDYDARAENGSGQPCPFCGGTHLTIAPLLRSGCSDGEPDAWASSVRCNSCAAEGPWRKGSTPEEANQRAVRQWASRC